MPFPSPVLCMPAMRCALLPCCVRCAHPIRPRLTPPCSITKEGMVDYREHSFLDNPRAEKLKGQMLIVRVCEVGPLYTAVLFQHILLCIGALIGV